MHRPELRSVPRFFLNQPLPAFAGGRTVRVIDICVKGARLEHTQPFTPGADISLAIKGAYGEIGMKATVMWCELDSLQPSASQDRYLTGVVFRGVTQVIHELIDDLSRAKAVIRIEDERNYDRYSVSAPLTASFRDISPVSIVDISMRGAKIEASRLLNKGMTGQLIFQVDAEIGPVAVISEVMWARETVDGAFLSGLQIGGSDEVMAQAIHGLCRRGEARIDLQALRRKFDALRVQSLADTKAGAA